MCGEDHRSSLCQKPRTGDSYLTRTIHEYQLGRPIISSGGAVLSGLLDEPHLRFRPSYVREVQAGFGLERRAKIFMNTPGSPSIQQAACPI
jgi:hypothetical protein